MDMCSINPATLLPCPDYRDLGQWLCVPPFQAVCLFRIFLSNNMVIIDKKMTGVVRFLWINYGGQF